MKTLDEVIEALARDEYYCIECPLQYSCGGAEGGCYLSEAARYLHEYQWHMTNPDGDHLQLEKCRALLQDFYRNVPLTWDELKQMEGKPVWVEDDTGTKFYRGWAIILNFLYDDTFLLYVCNDYSETCVSIDNLGKTWQAYRKERK